MTLQELLTAALQQLDRSTDAQTLETWRDKLTRYLNDAIVDLAGELRPRRTETAQVSGRRRDLTLLERPCIKVLALRQDGRRLPFYYGACTASLHVPGGTDGPAEITYQYMPLMLAADTDVPELPERCHGALVTYAVARERAAGDATAAAQTGFALYHQMRRALRANCGELDSYRIENAY